MDQALSVAGTARPVYLAVDVYAALQTMATPLQDDINTVLRRALGLTPPPATTRERARPRPGTQRAARGSVLPLSAYEQPILRALVALGGRTPTREVLSWLGQNMATVLTPVDRQPLTGGGGIRWQDRAAHARLRLIQRGHMLSGSPRGVWEISPAGRQLVHDPNPDTSPDNQRRRPS